MSRFDVRVRFGNDILMFNRDNWNVQPNHFACFTGKIARRADNMFTSDFTLVGGHLPCTSGGTLNRCHSGIAVYFSAAITRPTRQSLGQVGWLNVAIIWMTNPANQPISVTHWPILFDLIRCQNLHINTNRARNTSILPIFIHPVLGRSKANVRHVPKPDIHADFLL